MTNKKPETVTWGRLATNVQYDTEKTFFKERKELVFNKLQSILNDIKLTNLEVIQIEELGTFENSEVVGYKVLGGSEVSFTIEKVKDSSRNHMNFVSVIWSVEVKRLNLTICKEYFSQNNIMVLLTDLQNAVAKNYDSDLERVKNTLDMF